MVVLIGAYSRAHIRAPPLTHMTLARQPNPVQRPGGRRVIHTSGRCTTASCTTQSACIPSAVRDEVPRAEGNRYLPRPRGTVAGTTQRWELRVLRPKICIDLYRCIRSVCQAPAPAPPPLRRIFTPWPTQLHPVSNQHHRGPSSAPPQCHPDFSTKQGAVSLIGTAKGPCRTNRVLAKGWHRTGWGGRKKVCGVGRAPLPPPPGGGGVRERGSRDRALTKVQSDAWSPMPGRT